MAAVTPEVVSPVLADSEVVYMIVYVDDLGRARAFYEDRLGMQVVEPEESSFKLDVGGVFLWLRRAADDGIELGGGTDDSCDLVFLVEDALAQRRVLEKRGIEIAHQRTYGVGRVVDFYDPDGHRLMIYEPSEHALNTPVADQLRDAWRTSGRGAPGIIGPSALPAAADDAEAGIDGKPLVYFWLFIRDIEEGAYFFERQLGLRVLDRSHCCSDHCADDAPGVVKYDGGAVMLSTHHMHGHHSVVDDDGKPYAARDYDPRYAKGIAPVFRVDRLDEVVEALRARGVAFRNGPLRTSSGVLAGFESPTGHLFYVYEPG
jgi:catechol 2,3-dioxygenase-like lactoylglutathione lyase family enzyme